MRPARPVVKAARAALAAVVVGLVPATPAAAKRPPVKAIRTPDGTAVCRLRGHDVICTNRALQARAQPLVLVLGSKGTPRLADGVVVWGWKTEVLRVGARRRLGPFDCRSLVVGLLCTRRDGAGVSVGKERISTLLPAVTGR